MKILAPLQISKIPIVNPNPSHRILYSLFLVLITLTNTAYNFSIILKPKSKFCFLVSEVQLENTIFTITADPHPLTSPQERQNSLNAASTMTNYLKIGIFEPRGSKRLDTLRQTATNSRVDPKTHKMTTKLIYQPRTNHTLVKACLSTNSASKTSPPLHLRYTRTYLYTKEIDERAKGIQMMQLSRYILWAVYMVEGAIDLEQDNLGKVRKSTNLDSIHNQYFTSKMTNYLTIEIFVILFCFGFQQYHLYRYMQKGNMV